jgi:hypothetical protein
MFEVETGIKSLFENTPKVFLFNTFAFENANVNSLPLVIFHQVVNNFYTQEPIANYSKIRSECALFLGSETNFSSDF